MKFRRQTQSVKIEAVSGNRSSPTQETPSPKPGKVVSQVPMEWEEHDDGGMTLIRLRGEIDLQHSPQLREVLQRRAAQQAPALVLDISEVRYIDSSGLATLVEYYQHSRRFGGRLALAGATSRVKSVFELVRLNEVFEFYPSVEAAQSALSKS